MTPPTQIPTLELTGGVQIPQLGFGVFKISDEEMPATLQVAFDAGYRHVDTAAVYRNERGVGEAIARSGLPREELFVTTKVWNSSQGRERSRASFTKSLDRLQLDHLDLYLIHWPAAANGLFIETWETLLELQREGLVRSVGVSNFRVQDLDAIIAATGVAPAINQIELHPYLQQDELRAHHARHGIVTEAWSPLALGGELLTDPAITRIAEAHGRTAAQVVLRWHVQLGVVVIPKSATPHRIRENADLFAFELTSADMDAIAQLDRGQRTGMDPDVVA